ncbi:MAG: hypothetical protein FJ038_11345, partial [Chloroflexi bacterium]|nr:hypothetical protein [Chloroflexota bacterium]
MANAAAAATPETTLRTRLMPNFRALTSGTALRYRTESSARPARSEPNPSGSPRCASADRVSPYPGRTRHVRARSSRPCAPAGWRHRTQRARHGCAEQKYGPVAPLRRHLAGGLRPAQYPKGVTSDPSLPCDTTREPGRTGTPRAADARSHGDTTRGGAARATCPMPRCGLYNERRRSGAWGPGGIRPRRDVLDLAGTPRPGHACRGSNRVRMGVHRLAVVVLLATASVCPPAAEVAAGDTLDDYALTTWGRRDGLPSSYVYAIAQDQRGYYWVGTSGGLVRFDGVSFLPWPRAGERRLLSEQISALFAGSDDTLWVGFSVVGGVSRIARGRVTNYTPAEGAPANSITAFLEDRDGAVWAASMLGLSRFTDDRWESITLPHELAGTVITDVHQDLAGTIWIGTETGPWRWNPARHQFDPAGDAPVAAASFSPDPDGRTWVARRDGVVLTLDATGTPETRLTVNTRPWRIRHDARGQLWMATRGDGLFRIVVSPKGQATTVERLSETQGLASNVIHEVFQDRQGCVWIGTQDGLHRLTPSVASPVAAFPVPGRPVRAILSSSGSVWIGTATALVRTTDAQATPVRDRDPGQLGASVLHADSRNRLWAADYGGALKRVQDGALVPVPASAGLLNRVSAITSTPDGVLWIVDPTQGLFRAPDGVLTGGDPPLLRRPGGIAAFTDSRANVWIGFLDGSLVRFERGEAREYSSADGLPGGAHQQHLRRQRGPDLAGHVHGTGPVRRRSLRADARAHTTWTANVRGIIEDLDGALWLAIETGLVRIAPDQLARATDSSGHPLAYTLFDATDGIPDASMDIGFPTVARDTHGYLWFVTGTNVVAIDPALAVTRPPAPSVHIERVTVNGESEYEPAPGLELGSDASRVLVTYTGLGVPSPSKLRFRYMLEGFDEHWVDAGTERSVSFTNLAPGDYRFHVMATADGLWSGSEDVWEFTVLPAFYQTYTFYAAILAVAALAAWGAWQLRARRMHEHFSAVLAERTRIAREIHDTLLQGLIGVSLQCDDLSSRLETSPAGAREQLQRLRRQVSEYIRDTHDSISDLRSPSTASPEFAEALRLAAERTIGRSARLDFVLRGQSRRLAPDVEGQLLRIAREAIVNALRHARATTIRVELRYEPRTLLLRIVDDGIGFSVEDIDHRPASPWGLIGMRERAQQLGGEWHVTSTAGHGTTIAVSVPITEASPGRPSFARSA